MPVARPRRKRRGRCPSVRPYCQRRQPSRMVAAAGEATPLMRSGKPGGSTRTPLEVAASIAALQVRRIRRRTTLLGSSRVLHKPMGAWGSFLFLSNLITGAQPGRRRASGDGLRNAAVQYPNSVSWERLTRLRAACTCRAWHAGLARSVPGRRLPGRWRVHGVVRVLERIGLRVHRARLPHLPRAGARLRCGAARAGAMRARVALVQALSGSAAACDRVRSRCAPRCRRARTSRNWGTSRTWSLVRRCCAQLRARVLQGRCWRCIADPCPALARRARSQRRSCARWHTPRCGSPSRSCSSAGAQQHASTHPDVSAPLR